MLQVGIFDVNKNAPPDLMRNFCGKNIYRICHGHSPEMEKYVLFACNDKNLMIFPTHSKNNNCNEYPSLKFSSGVSTVNANENHLFIGTSDGMLRILTSVHQEIFKEKLSRKYISDVACNPVNVNVIAVSSLEETIHILKNTGTDTKNSEFKKISELIGHKQGVTCLKWSNECENRLVSASYDYSVRVWNTDTQECIAINRYDSKMYCAIFMPGNENFILCSGQSETLHIFDIRTHSDIEEATTNGLYIYHFL